VLQQLQEWIETEYTKNIQSKPLWLTIAGVAGSGKSTLVNTLVALIRNFFQDEGAVKVCGPTGAAAYNAGGVTCHHAFKLPFQSSLITISDKHVKELRQAFSGLVCLIIDERSMISSEVMASMEHRARHCANNGLCSNQEWGNIPIVILVGDDYQIPPVQQGMVHSMEKHYEEQIMNKPYRSNKKYNITMGEELFKTFAKDVMVLDTSKRQHRDQDYFMELLEKARCEDDTKQMQKQDARFLCKYHIEQHHFDQKKVQEMKNDPETLFLFATNSEKDKCNDEMLFKQHSSNNPVAKITTYTTNKHGATVSGHSKHFSKSANIMNRTYICRNVKVSLYGKT
jgi:energy-coupling factor transporter ATP-binding protein EcfA2